jgi:RHH-type proline utilization regulon transcriptional repressor/proline dehydrogenase/delta 1-pyrroline-5-carboxylate dehydrogenase
MGPKGAAELCSFDMLGEGARTMKDAARYFDNYARAIKTLCEGDNPALPEDKHGISVKLSALYPKYDSLHTNDVMDILYPKVLELCEMAKKGNLNLCLDAEEADRLVISFQILEKLCREPSLDGWSGLGLALQAYQKRGPMATDQLIELAKTTRRRLMIRLVKGAYWDSEIKHSQVEGHPDFPVWTRKSTTDLSYLACARTLLKAGTTVYPQFATHNTHTVAAIEHMAVVSKASAFEFQRLHGMGDPLYHNMALTRPVRVYAPVGAHEDLLPYLVRRLLENGANTSFVHSFLDEDVAAEDVARSPFSDASPTRHGAIPKPNALFGARKNSKGVDLTQITVQKHLSDLAAKYKPSTVASLVAKKLKGQPGVKRQVFSPSDASVVGTVTELNPKRAAEVLTIGQAAFPSWNKLGGVKRAEILNRFADLLEAEMDDFIVLLSKEAGKCLGDNVAEIREAVDFCRYYADQAAREFTGEHTLPGPAGELNTLRLSGRGTFVCISPWNFPLAIYVGQVVAALAAGNAVVAKPAEQTPLVAHRAAELLYKAGVPRDVFQLTLGAGELGAALVNAPYVAGVVFTGSTEVAKKINMALASKDGPIPMLIAETGGLNGMFVDTTALKEQVMDDVTDSAFNAAGQRCSALRVLFLPEHTADEIIAGIVGAMDALDIGDPSDPATSVGPVIDHDALTDLQNYLADLPSSMKIVHQCELPTSTRDGTYLAPTLIRAKSLEDVNKEMFGPILHVLRYKDKDLDKMAQAFAAKGYGLTLGIHSRLEVFANRIMRNVPAGNVYINRNIIGAVVGVQPFGGSGLSGTGPKAGGPHYLHRFATEITVSNNITAQGGDPALLNLAD